jgi:hypothetical protein
VTFNVGVANAGGEAANGIDVAISLPPGLTYVSNNGGGTYAGGTWTIPALAAGSTVGLQLVARADTLLPVAVGAEIMTATPFDPDSTPGNGNVGHNTAIAMAAGLKAKARWHFTVVSTQHINSA